MLYIIQHYIYFLVLEINRLLCSLGAKAYRAHYDIFLTDSGGQFHIFFIAIQLVIHRGSSIPFIFHPP